MKTFFKVLVGLIIVGAIGYTMYFLYQKSQDEPIVYETDSPVVIDIVKKTTATGSVVPRKEIEIKPIVSGIIEEIYVAEGEMVKKGDLIARIRIIPNMINVNNAKSRIEVAKINLKETKTNYDRQLSLLEKGVIARADFESYETGYKSALEELETAQETLDLIQEGQTKNSGGKTNTLVRSQIDGMILDIPVELGIRLLKPTILMQVQQLQILPIWVKWFSKATLMKPKLVKLKKECLLFSLSEPLKIFSLKHCLNILALKVLK